MKHLSIVCILIAVLLAGTGCESEQARLERTEDFFADNVWTPFLKTKRCSNCHDFEAQKATFYPAHPGSGVTCTGCHSSTVLGFADPTWHLPPAADNWSTSSDAFAVRRHILELGPNLYIHLLGEGVDQQPLVQWGFFNGPDTVANGGTIKAGGVPTGQTGQAHPSGQIPTNELLDWNLYKAAVEEWLCLEKRLGNDNLGLPDNVNCFGILFCGTVGLTSTVATFGALACIVTVRRYRRRRR